MSEKDIYTKQSFINLIARTMRSMELKILVSGIDYSSPLPHLVAVYPDIEKYYLMRYNIIIKNRITAALI